LAAGVALGLAALSKYTAVFLAVGLAVTVVTDSRLRRLFRQPRLYGAALLCLATLTPVAVWNVQHDFASFRFHSTEHLQGGLKLYPSGFVHFLIPTLLFVSPVLGFGMLSSLRRDPAGETVYASILRRMGLAVFAASSAVFVALSFVAWSLYYWNVVAYLLLLPPAVGFFATRLRALRWHLLIGVVLVAAMVFHGTVVPFSALVKGARDDDSFELFGWSRVVEAMRGEQRPGEQLLTDDYRPAAHLDWTLGKLAAVVISERPSQFDLWQEPGLRGGDSAIVLTDERGPLTPELEAQFERVTHLRTVPVMRLGLHLKDYELWRAEGYRGPSIGSSADPR
jgi:hypothetical protein